MSAGNEEKMKGMVAIVTGSSSGIGAAIAIAYARQGAKVVITGRNQEKLKAVEQKCEEASSEKLKPHLIIGDVTDEDFRKKLITETIEHFGHLDVLVNNAGFFKAVPVEVNAGVDTLDDMYSIHVRAPYHLSKLAVPHLIESKGTIINISSVGSFKPSTTVGLEYCVAKAAMDQLTKWFAYGLGSKGVRVNSINPGAIPTDIIMNSAGVSQEESNAVFGSFGRFHALARVGDAEEVASVAVFLACKDSSFVTGTLLPVDGGFLVLPPALEIPSSE